MSDPRFARLRTDPRFRKPKKHQQKVVVDERFKDVFHDDKKGAQKKSNGGRVDKYGRRVSASQEKDNLRRFYRLEGDEVEESSEAAPKLPDFARGEVLLESSDEEEADENSRADVESDDDDGGEVVLGRHASKPIPVLAGEDQLEVDLNEDDDVYADLDAQAAAYAKEHAEEDEAEGSGTQTNRLAVVNLDWDYVRASHLYKIFSSLVSSTASSIPIPPNSNGKRKGDGKPKASTKVVRGKVLSVRIYPSDFGKDRMKKEEVEGPPKEIFKKTRRDDAEASLDTLLQEDEGDEYDEAALRKYQLERLRYYYAIVTFDSAEAASHLMAELDGTELERTANVFDLSYVPDEMSFDDEFRDEATPATEASSSTYGGLEYSTDALRHSKVKLKWDEDDPERTKVLRRALTKKEIEEDDFRAYIASDSDGSADEAAQDKSNKKSERDKMRSLLLGGGNDELPEGWDADPFGNEDKDGAEGEMEITFMPGLSEAKAKASDEETTLDKYKRKQKEKRLERKKELQEKIESKKVPKDGEKGAKSAKDDFFDAGSSGSASEDEDAPKNRKSGKSKSKSSKARSASPAEQPRPASEAELALLAASDGTTKKAEHFNMKAILKAEKTKGRKRNRKGNKVGASADGEDELQEDFKLDVKDDRFKALHEDPTFAIDPSNPRFQKTKGMSALLEERTKRQRKGVDSNETTHKQKTDVPSGDVNLQSLVESVKRKSTHLESKGKRRKL